MEDYKEIIKEMLLRDFSPYPPKGEHSTASKSSLSEGDGEQEFSAKEMGSTQLSQKLLSFGEAGERMTTLEILKMVQGIIPQSPINEHDIFEVLKEIGFQYKLVGMEHITDDKELILYEYRWILWKKDVDL